MAQSYIKQMLTALAILLFSTAANAHDFEVDGIYYNILSETDLTVEVTFEGSSYASSSRTYADSVTIPSTVDYNDKTYCVASIGERAFFKCEKLTSVVVPTSVTTIKPYAFHTCVNLKNVTLPNTIDKIDNYLFQESSKLESVNLSENIKSIGNRAFYKCEALTSIGNTNGVTFVDEKAFDETKWLNERPDGMLYLGKALYCYSGELTKDTAIVKKRGQHV